MTDLRAVMEMYEEELKLFAKFADALSGEFYDLESAQRAEEMAVAIAETLFDMGFRIDVRLSWTFRKEILADGQEINFSEQKRLLILVPITSETNQTPIAQKEVTAKIYPEEARGRQISTKISSSDIHFLLTSGTWGDMEDKLEHLWKREWTFSPEERHALKDALDRHWNLLWDLSRLLKKKPPKRETVENILQTAGLMAPADVDAITFSFLAEEEIKRLERLNPEDILEECDCEVKEHLESLKNWLQKNLS